MDAGNEPGAAGAERIEYEDLEGLVHRLGLAASASELHGSVCGFLAGGGSANGATLLTQLQWHADAPAGGVAPAEQEALAALLRFSAAALADTEMGFEPLLPADDRPLLERAEATVEWCRGFLGGFGLTGASSHAHLSDEAQEMLRDLGAIAASSFNYGDENEDEDALIEVHEFMRVGAMLLHAEGAAPLAGASGTVH